MDTVRQRMIAVPVAAILGLAILTLFGCQEQTHRLYAGRCAANGGGYSITTTCGGTDTTFEGTWGECSYYPTFGEANPLLILFDSRVTMLRDEEGNVVDWVVPDGFHGIIRILIGMAPVEEPGSIPVESYPFDSWGEFADASLDGDIAMATVSFSDYSWEEYWATSGNGGTLVIEDVDWPGPDQTGELVFHSGDDMVFPAVDYDSQPFTARVSMSADLTLTTVRAEGESGSMLNGLVAQEHGHPR